MSRRVLVLGATGMLGASIFRSLSKSDKWQVSGTVRDRKNAHPVIQSVGDTAVLDGVNALQFETVISAIRASSPDYVVNCIGAVKQLEDKYGAATTIELNSLFPHKLATACSSVGARLIHFSTDCVFTEAKGGYVESDSPDAADLYGRSKALGEVTEEPHLTLRTSIIGHEVNTAHSLVDWYLGEKSAIKGFRGAIFSGLPTVVVAEILENWILSSNCSGLYHLSASPINKFDLLTLVKKTYGFGANIEPVDTYQVDKSLDSSRLKSFLGLHIDPWPKLIKSMYQEYNLYFRGRS